jgi:hypothetical protein
MEVQWLVDEKTALDNDLVCPICQNVMSDPTMITSCQHAFCNECISGWIIQKKTCPQCRVQAKETIPDRRAKKQISMLKVKCKESEFGCEAVGELGIPPNTFWSKHATECVIKTCPHCAEKVKGLQDHVNSCDKAIVPCPFKKLGCPGEFRKRELEKHIEESMEFHYVNMIRYVSDRDPELIDLPVVTGGTKVLKKKCAVCRSNPIFGPAFKCEVCSQGQDVFLCLECKTLSPKHKEHALS